MDAETHVDAHNACVCADSCNRIAQSCAEAVEAMAYAGDFAGSASEYADRQRELRQQVRAILDALVALSKAAAHDAGVAAGGIPVTLAEPRRMAHVDATAAERNARKCFGITEQCAKAWGMLA